MGAPAVQASHGLDTDAVMPDKSALAAPRVAPARRLIMKAEALPARQRAAGIRPGTQPSGLPEDTNAGWETGPFC